MDQKTRDYRVGLFVLIAFVLLGLLIVIYGEQPVWFWARKWDLNVYVENPYGVEEGTPAFLQGVQIGRVKAIELRDRRVASLGAAVIIEVDEQFDVPQSSSAQLHAKFGFDKGAIHIRPPPEREDPLPKDGSASIHGVMVGPLASVVPEEFIEQLVQAVEEISKVGLVADDLHELLAQRALSDVDNPQISMVANLHSFVQRLDQSFKLLNEILLEGGTSDIRESIAELRTSTTHLREWSEQLEPRTQQLIEQSSSTLQALEQRTLEVASAAVDTLGRMSKLLDQTTAAMNYINTGEGTLGMMVYDEKLYEELVFSMEKLQVLLDEWTRTAISIQEEGILKGL